MANEAMLIIQRKGLRNSEAQLCLFQKCPSVLQPTFRNALITSRTGLLSSLQTVSGRSWAHGLLQPFWHSWTLLKVLMVCTGERAENARIPLTLLQPAFPTKKHHHSPWYGKTSLWPSRTWRERINRRGNGCLHGLIVTEQGRMVKTETGDV